MGGAAIIASSSSPPGGSCFTAFAVGGDENGDGGTKDGDAEVK
jgi:hypothetical protein